MSLTIDVQQLMAGSQSSDADAKKMNLIDDIQQPASSFHIFESENTELTDGSDPM